MFRIAICAVALFVSAAGSPALAAPETVVVDVTADSIKGDLTTTKEKQIVLTHGDKVKVDSHGWVEEDWVVVMTEDGRNAELHADSVKLALDEARIQKQIAKHSKPKRLNNAVAKGKH